MAIILSASTANPEFILSQSSIKKFVFNLFQNKINDIDRLINVFENSQIQYRHFAVPVDWTLFEHSFKERNEIFSKAAFDLSVKCITDLLEKTNIYPTDFTSIIYVSSTGVMTPTLDALLFNKFSFNKNIKRIPLWGLGCAAGASALSRANDLTRANPNELCLILSVELCSLTFQNDDISKSNLIAASLFSDGCASAVLAGENNSYVNNNKNYPVIIDTLSVIYPDSLDIMGWEIVESGFKVIFNRDIPNIVKDKLKPEIDFFLEKSNLQISDIKHYITHPGGIKVINAFADAMNLNDDSISLSKKVLKEHGNMSSASVLYVLEEFLIQNSYQSGDYGLISALGPGFSAELILFKII